MEITKAIINGGLVNPEIFKYSNEDILEKFKRAIGIQTSLSLGAGYPILPSATYMLVKAYNFLKSAEIGCALMTKSLSGDKKADIKALQSQL